MVRFSPRHGHRQGQGQGQGKCQGHSHGLDKGRQHLLLDSVTVSLLASPFTSQRPL